MSVLFSLFDVLVVAGGFVIGVLSGLLGIGGGILLVPLLTIGFGSAQQVAQGTSLAAIIPTSIVGALTHDRLGNVDRRVAAWTALGAVVGTVIGAFLALRLPHDILARGFGALMLVAAWRIWAGRTAKYTGTNGSDAG